MKVKRTKPNLIDTNGNATDYYRACEIMTGPITVESVRAALSDLHTAGSTTILATMFGWGAVEVIDGDANWKSHMDFAFRRLFCYSLEFTINRVVKLHKAQLTDGEIIDSELTESVQDEKTADSITESLFGISYRDLISFIIGCTRSYLLDRKKVLYDESGWVSVANLPSHVANCIFEKFAMARVAEVYPELIDC